MLKRILLVVCVLLGTAAAAEDLSAPDPMRVKLLDEVPNYARVLADQWSSTRRVETIEDSGRHYGLLVDSGAPRTITLEESIALALEHNTGLRVQRLNPIAASARVRATYGQFDTEFFGEVNKTYSNSPVSTQSVLTNQDPEGPEVDFEQPSIFNDQRTWDFGLRKGLVTGGLLTAEWGNQRFFSNPNAINLVNPEYVTQLNLTLNQPLLRNFGWRFSLLIVDAAQIAEEQAFYDYKAQVALLVENVERAYWTYVLAIESVRVDEKGLDLAKELLRQNQGRFNVGALPRTAVLESEAEVARREAGLVRSRALQRIARDNLRALINAKDDDSGALLLLQPADTPAVVPEEVDLDESLKTAFTQRPELVAARLNLEGRQVDRRIAQNRLLPRFDIVGSLGLNGLGGERVPTTPMPNNPIASNPNPQVLGGYDRSLTLLTDGRYYQYLVGAVIVVPLANAAADAEYAQARINAEAAHGSLQQLEENVTLEITQAVNNLNALVVSIQATRIARELAEENVRNQQARYDVGLATTKDLIDFQDRLTQAQRSEIESLALYNTELARLRFAEGTLLAKRNVHLDRPAPEGRPWWAMF